MDASFVPLSYLYDVGNKRDYIGELLHVHIEVLQVVPQGLVGDDGAPLPYGLQTAEIAGGVELRVGGLWEVHLGHGEGGGEGGQRGAGTAGAA